MILATKFLPTSPNNLNMSYFNDHEEPAPLGPAFPLPPALERPACKRLSSDLSELFEPTEEFFAPLPGTAALATPATAASKPMKAPCTEAQRDDVSPAQRQQQQQQFYKAAAHRSRLRYYLKLQQLAAAASKPDDSGDSSSSEDSLSSPAISRETSSCSLSSLDSEPSPSRRSPPIAIPARRRPLRQAHRSHAERKKGRRKSPSPSREDEDECESSEEEDELSSPLSRARPLDPAGLFPFELSMPPVRRHRF